MFDPGRDTPIIIGDKTWTVGRITPEVMFPFRDWIKAKIGDPFAMADRYIDKLPPAESMALIKEAQAIKEQLDCFSLKTELAQRFMQAEEGITELIRLCLQKHHPGATRELAWDVIVSAGKENLNKAIETASGSMPPEKNC